MKIIDHRFIKAQVCLSVMLFDSFETEEQNSDSKCFYVDSVGYKELDNFDTSLCEDMEGEKVVYITPHHTPLVLNMHINDYKNT